MAPRDEIPLVIMYTDGACKPNPGKGGYAALITMSGISRRRIVQGGNPNTTNNRMDLAAVIAGLEELTRRCNVTVLTDSEYVEKGINERLKKWLNNGQLSRMKNADLWQRLNGLMGKHEVSAVWVRGHNGNPLNEKVDRLALTAAYRTGGLHWRESWYEVAEVMV